ncbi:MAG: hypothetical protein ACKVKT_03230 [Rhodospirillales bacterium]
MPGGLSEVGNVAQNPLDRIAPEVVADQPGLLDRIGKSVVNPSLAFLNDQSLSEFERDKAESVLLDTRIEGERQSNEAARIAAEEQQQMQELSRIAFGDGPDADDALKEIFSRNPTMANNILDGLGARDTASREEAARDASAIQAVPFADRRAVILDRVARIEAQGGDASQTLSLLDMDEDAQNNSLRVIQSAALTAAQRVVASGSGGKPAEQVAFDALIKDFSPENQELARMVKAGLIARASLSADERIAVDEILAAQVAASKGVIAEAQEFGKLTGIARANQINVGFDAIKKIDANNLNLDQAIAALDAGAETGSIWANFTPTFREATVLLDQVRATLGLDVVSAVSFGALSEKELEVAMDTALPDKLDEPALRTWIINRKAAQAKLRSYYDEQIEWLEVGGPKKTGGTIGGFLREQKRKNRGAGSNDTTSTVVNGYTIEEVR